MKSDNPVPDALCTLLASPTSFLDDEPEDMNEAEPYTYPMFRPSWSLNDAEDAAGFESPYIPSSMSRYRLGSRWSVDQFVLKEQLYQSCRSKLFDVTDRVSGRRLALKLYRRSQMAPLNKMQVEREVNIQINLQHKNIIQLYAAFADERNVYLVQEFADGGDLFKKVQIVGSRCSEEMVQSVMASFLAVLQYLHDRGVIHRDIKPENILLMSDGTIKLADFGLAIDLTAERPVTRLGTLEYMAPEVLVNPDKQTPEENKGNDAMVYTKQVDVWAAGVLTFELLVGRAPFQSSTYLEVCQGILHREPMLPSWLSKQAKSFIRAALCKDARRRPTIGQLANHPWLKGAGVQGASLGTPATPAAAAATAVQKMASAEWHGEQQQLQAQGAVPPLKKLAAPGRVSSAATLAPMLLSSAEQLASGKPAAAQHAWPSPPPKPKVGFPSPSTAAKHALHAGGTNPSQLSPAKSSRAVRALMAEPAFAAVRNSPVKLSPLEKAASLPVQASLWRPPPPPLSDTHGVLPQPLHQSEGQIHAPAFVGTLQHPLDRAQSDTPAYSGQADPQDQPAAATYAAPGLASALLPPGRMFTPRTLSPRRTHLPAQDRSSAPAAPSSLTQPEQPLSAATDDSAARRLRGLSDEGGMGEGYLSSCMTSALPMLSPVKVAPDSADLSSPCYHAPERSNDAPPPRPSVLRPHHSSSKAVECTSASMAMGSLTLCPDPKPMLLRTNSMQGRNSEVASMGRYEHVVKPSAAGQEPSLVPKSTVARRALDYSNTGFNCEGEGLTHKASELGSVSAAGSGLVAEAGSWTRTNGNGSDRPLQVRPFGFFSTGAIGQGSMYEHALGLCRFDPEHASTTRLGSSGGTPQHSVPPAYSHSLGIAGSRLAGLTKNGAYGALELPAMQSAFSMRADTVSMPGFPVARSSSEVQSLMHMLDSNFPRSARP